LGTQEFAMTLIILVALSLLPIAVLTLWAFRRSLRLVCPDCGASAQPESETLLCRTPLILETVFRCAGCQRAISRFAVSPMEE
jgi:hypothetical protein